MLRRLNLWSLLAVSILLVACNQLGVVAYSDDGQPLPAPSGRGLVARPNSPIPDVPMPIGFVGVAGRSRASIVGGLRNVDHVYQGRAAIGDVVEFYRGHLRSNQWSIHSQDVTGALTLIEATRGSETLTIQITRPRNVTNVRVIIQPASAGDNAGAAATPAPAPAAPPPPTGTVVIP